jgi:hypothetical protein
LYESADEEKDKDDDWLSPPKPTVVPKEDAQAKGLTPNKDESALGDTLLQLNNNSPI